MKGCDAQSSFRLNYPIRSSKFLYHLVSKRTIFFSEMEVLFCFSFQALCAFNEELIYNTICNCFLVSLEIHFHLIYMLDA